MTKVSNSEWKERVNRGVEGPLSARAMVGSIWRIEYVDAKGNVHRVHQPQDHEYRYSYDKLPGAANTIFGMGVGVTEVRAIDLDGNVLTFRGIVRITQEG
jgi:hypothetical protein